MSSSEASTPVAYLEDLEDLYENAPCGYLSFDATGHLVKANHTVCLLLGFSQDELLGHRLHDFLNPAGRIFFETHFAPLLRMQGHFNEVAMDFVKRDGSKLHVLANALERRTPDGELQFTRLTIFLATDRRRYERELVEARATAEKLNKDLMDLNAGLETRVIEAVAQRLKAEHGLVAEMEIAELREQFIAVLGHDLRNPVASFVAGIRLLQKEQLTARGKEVIVYLQDSSRRMSDLIDNVLDFARGRLGGGIGLSPGTSAPLEPLLTRIVEELQLARPDATIITSFGINEPVLCDHVRLGQLVSNLLGNAITHGSLADPIRLHAETKSGRFELWVANSGSPIPQAAMERLFHPFFRGEVRNSQQGLGLGLHIASEIAKAHGGTLTVSSSMSETRFTLRMPVSLSAAPIGSA